MAVLSKGNLFDPHLVKDLISKVRGRSSLAALSQQIPVSFNGNKEFVFSMDSDIDIVAENGKKKAGGLKLEPITIRPIKYVYQARVSDEFMRAAEEEQISILEAFNDGFAKRVAAGLDISAMHGLNPSTSAASDVIGTNHFDSAVTQTVEYAAETPDESIEQAIETVEAADREVNGIVISSAVRANLAAMKDTNGDKLYPEFAFGGKPTTLGAQRLEINKTVAVGEKDNGIVGDFANAFKWGYAAEIPLEIIQYGDPDNTGVDLKGSNQVCLRAEVYLGWGILDPASFARIVPAAD